jgi:hypothetical protein
VQLVVQSIEGKFKAVGDIQFVIDPAQVVLDHLLGSTELVSYFLVAFALRDARDDGQLFGLNLAKVEISAK